MKEGITISKSDDSKRPRKKDNLEEKIKKEIIEWCTFSASCFFEIGNSLDSRLSGLLPTILVGEGVMVAVVGVMYSSFSISSTFLETLILGIMVIEIFILLFSGIVTISGLHPQIRHVPVLEHPSRISEDEPFSVFKEYVESKDILGLYEAWMNAINKYVEESRQKIGKKSRNMRIVSWLLVLSLVLFLIAIILIVITCVDY